MNTLTVLYDEHCAVCRRAHRWLSTEDAYVNFELLAAGSPAAQERYGSLPWKGTELVVVSDDGDAWIGHAAFLTCLWATVRYRPLSYLLSRRALVPLAEVFFKHLSKHRGRLGRFLKDSSDDCVECHN